jgi:flagellar hook-length control protein FliK
MATRSHAAKAAIVVDEQSLRASRQADASAEDSASTPTTILRGAGAQATTPMFAVPPIGAAVQAPVSDEFGGRGRLKLESDRVSYELAASQGTSQTTAPTDQARATPELRLAQHVAQQLVALAKPLPNGAVELSLNPEELGRVRMTLSPAEAGLSVSITAERPETLELMRRNADILAQEFRNLGYDSTSFNFGDASHGTGQPQDEAPNGPDLSLEDLSDAVASEPSIQTQVIARDGRVDLRL